MQSFAGRVAVVTGGASGMGRATAERFLDAGAQVVVADLNEATGRDVLDDVSARGFGDAVQFVRTDVSDEADVQRMIGTAIESFGRVDIVFNNAGIMGAIGSILETRAEDWDYTMAVLLRSVFLGIKHGGRALVAQGEGGAIVNTASVAAVVGSAGPTAYAAAKAGVVNLTRYAAVELAPHRIRVNAVCPGAIVTPMAGDPEEAAERMRSRQPWPEPGQSANIASVVTFLASEDAAFVTGEAVVVDGGMVAAGPRVMVPSTDMPVVLNHGTTGRAPEPRGAAGSA